jgi:serine/threonine-protein kinase RsbW
MIPAVAAAVREAAVCFGLSPDAADELKEACQALLRRIAASYVDDPQRGCFDVKVSRRPGRIAVQIDDRGAPYELAFGARGETGAGIDAQSDLLALVRERVDRLSYEYRGRAGNRVELLKRITRSRRSKGGPTEVANIDPGRPVEVRPMVPADGVAFVRNVYRSFGYTYGGEWAYHADDVGQLLEAGVLTAWVAVDPDGAIVGHAAIHREHPDLRLGEGGAAVVDPAFRHHGVALKLGLAALEWVKEQQLFGIFGFATTRHPYSQKAVIDMGGREVGLMLGFVPASVVYRSIEEGGRGRAAVMVMYQRLGANPVQDVHAPRRHREMLRRIYDGAQLNGDFVDTGRPPERISESQMSVSVQTDRKFAHLDITQIGADLGNVVGLQLEGLARGGITTAYVDLPLSLPQTPHGCDELERVGLLFAGVFPADDDAGMRLRLQHIGPDVVLGRDDIEVASDFGAELRAYVLAARSGAST